MSVVLLASSLILAITHIPDLNSLSAIGAAYFSFNEGREAYEKVAGMEERIYD